MLAFVFSMFDFLKIVQFETIIDRLKVAHNIIVNLNLEYKTDDSKLTILYNL